nr:unnamed protein product [Callosobruchus chinensis]
MRKHQTGEWTDIAPEEQLWFRWRITSASTTFRRSGYRQTIIDITLSTYALAAHIGYWRILEDFTGSDHQYIKFCIELIPHADRQPMTPNPTAGWIVSKLNHAKFVKRFNNLPFPSILGSPIERSGEEVEALVNQLMQHITTCCDSAMPKRKSRANRTPVYWWTPTIDTLRKDALKLRRIAQRSRGRTDTGDAREQYRLAKKKLRREIRSSKRQCWLSLCKQIDEDEWGLGFKIVMQRFGKQTPVAPDDPRAMEDIVDTLFPSQPIRAKRIVTVEGAIPLFTLEELKSATESLKCRKDPGPDAIPIEVIKLAAEERPTIPLNVYNACLLNCVFQKRWKIQRLVLIDKAKGPPVTPSSFWPLCIILRMEIPEWAMLIGYADDIAAVIRARDPAEAKGRVELVVSLIHDWLKAHGLQLAISKTEIVVLTRQIRFPEPLWVFLNDTTLESKCAVKYLGEIIDAKLTHFKQICAAAHKAAKMVASLSRLMPNIAGPKPSKRRTLMSAAHSIMLYGAEIWADALMVQKYKKCLSSVQRTAALQVACAYRTVSEIAVLVVAGIPPIDMLAIERKMLYHKQKRGEVISSTQARSITLEKWQERWEQERDVGKWTHILIPRIEPWYTRKHGEINYYLSQFLTGHGLFNAYLYRIGKRNSAMCSYCSSEDDPRHTFFECERWESKRQLLVLVQF